MSLVVRITWKFHFDEVGSALRGSAQLDEIDVLETVAEKTSNTFEELVMFASVLGRNLGVRSANQGDGFAPTLLDTRPQHRVWRNLHELDPVGIFVRDDLDSTLTTITK